VEFQFYLLFPFLLVFYRKYGMRYLIWLVLLAVFFRWAVWIMTGTVQYFAYSTIFGRIDQFCLGMICSELALRHKHLFHSSVLLAALILFWVTIFHFFDRAGGFFDNPAHFPNPISSSFVWVYWPTLEGIFFGLITASYLGVSQFLPQFLDRLLAWLGTLSYSLYLNQNFAIQISAKAFKWAGLETAGFWNALVFGFCATLPLLIIMSAMTYYLVERPFLLLRSRYLCPFDGAKS
jgi:peptidoglycan/LPS O-acetylase OafA/YrhL